EKLPVDALDVVLASSSGQLGSHQFGMQGAAGRRQRPPRNAPLAVAGQVLGTEVVEDAGDVGRVEPGRLHDRRDVGKALQPDAGGDDQSRVRWVRHSNEVTAAAWRRLTMPRLRPPDPW